LFSADSHVSLGAPFGVDNVSEILGHIEQGDVLGRDFSDGILRSISEYSGVSIADIRTKGGRGMRAHSRALTCWELDAAGWEHKEIAEVLPIARSRISGAISHINKLANNGIENLTGADLELRNLFLGWKKTQ